MVDVAKLVLAVDSRGVKDANRDLNDFEKQAAKAERAGTQMGRNISNVLKAIGVGLFFRQVIRNTVEQQRVTAQLEAVLKSTGHAAGFNRDELLQMASAMQQVTTFGDEAVVGAQNVLLTFTRIGKEVFPTALESVLNVATALGMDLKSAAIQVGKALNDPVVGLTALTRSGITFTDEQKDVIKTLVETGRQADAQKLMLQELERQFGGSARAAKETLGGALQSLQNAFGDLLEGDASSPGVRDATSAINELTATLNDPQVKAGFAAIVGGITNIVRVAAQAIPKLMDITRWAGEELAAIRFGIASDDVVRLQQQADNIKRILNTTGLLAAGERIRFFGPGGIVEYWSKDELRAELKRIEEQVEVARKGLEQKPLVSTFAPTPDMTVDTVNVVSPADLKAAQKLQDAINDRIAALQTEAATLNMTEAEAELYRLTLMGASDAQLSLARAALEANDALTKQNAMLEEAKSIYEQTRTPAERLSAEIQHLNEMLEAGAFGEGEGAWDTYARAIFEAQDRFDEATKDMEKNSDKMSEFSKQAARNMQSHFADFLFDPFDKGVKGMLHGFVTALQRMVAEAAAAHIFDAIGGMSGSGGFLGAVGSFFSGAFANGTSSAPGGMALVGERGPELVNLPRGSQVIPNDKIGGVNVEIIDQRGANAPPVDVQQTANGLKVLIRSELNSALADGSMDRTLGAFYGVRRQGR